MTRVEELAGNAALVLFPNFPAEQRDTPTAVIAEAIRQALTEALGPASDAMMEVGNRARFARVGIEQNTRRTWEFMATVRLRAMGA